MSTDNRLLLVEIIKQQTALSIAANIAAINSKTQQPMSDRAVKIKREIEKSDFDNDEKMSLARMMSTCLNETIEIDTDEDDDEKSLKIELLTLLSCKDSGSDRRETSYDESTKILKLAIDIDNLYEESYPSEELLWGGLIESGQLEYCFTDEDIREDTFEFATEDEIMSFVAGLSDKTIDFWFESILITAKICKRI